MPFPFSITSQTPQILQHAGELGQRNVERFTNLLELHKERDKRDAEEAKRTRALAKMFQDDLGLAESDPQTMDTHTLGGMLEGHFLKNNQTHQEALRQLQLTNAKLNQQRMAFEVMREEQAQAQTRVPGEILRQASAGIPAPLNNEAFDQELSRRSGMSPAALSIIGAHAGARASLPPSVLDDLMRGGRTEGPIGIRELRETLGFVPTGAQVNPNGTVGLMFGPAPAEKGPAVPILTDKGEPTGKAMFEGKVIDLSPPGAEGKTLTQSETQMLAAFSQAEQDLANLEKMFKELGPDWGGPVSGRVKSTIGMGQNPNIAAIENAITAATPNLARGVFREVGVLTDEDIKRYKALLPTAYDTEAVRKVKMDQLRERIKTGRKETKDTLRKAGRDLSGFDEKDSSPAAVPATPAARAALANQLSEAHPDWSRERILEEVKRLLP